MIDSVSIGSFTGFKAHAFVAHSGRTNCVAVGPRSGQVIATGGDDKRVKLWRIGRASSIWSLTGNSSAIESLRFDPTEEFLVSGSAGGAVKLFDLNAGKMTRHFRGHMSNVTVIDCGSFDRRFVATGSMDCQVKLWNVETKECAMAFKGHNAEVTDVQLSPDGHILASAATDGQLKLWDLRAGKPMHTFQACSGAVRALRFNPQEFLLAASTSDRTVKLYDIELMELFCVTASDTSPTGAIAFDAEGQNVFCASPSGLRHWSWDNETATARLETMGDVAWGKVGAGALYYNNDARQILAASGSGARVVLVWAVNFDDEGDDTDEDEDIDVDPIHRRRQEQRSRRNQDHNHGHDRERDINGGVQSLQSPSTPPATADAAAGPRNPPRRVVNSRSEEPATLPLAGEPRAWDIPQDNQAAARPNDGAVKVGSRARIPPGISDETGSEIASAATGFCGGQRERGLGSVADNGGAKGYPRLSGDSTREKKSWDNFGGTQLKDSSKRVQEKKRRDQSPGSPRAALEVIGRLPASPVATAEEKSPSGRLAGAEKNGSAVLRPSRATVAPNEIALVPPTSPSEAEEAIATESSSSGRYRSIGTPVLETLVLASGWGRYNEGGVASPGSWYNDQRGAAAWAEPKSGSPPGKWDGYTALAPAEAVGAPLDCDLECLPGIGAAINRKERREQDADTEEEQQDAATSSRRNINAKSVGVLEETQTDKVRAQAGVNSRITEDSWLYDVGKGEAGDSPPLLGSEDSSPRLPSVVPSSSRSLHGEQNPSEEGETVVATRPAVGGFSTGAAVSVDTDLSTPSPGSVSSMETDLRGVAGGGHELGMTRPRTATRRWDRPESPGEDEVITNMLLSGAAFTSKLSERLAQLRPLTIAWTEGDVSGSISRLKWLERSGTAADSPSRAVMADFLWVVPLDGPRVTFEHCLELMPLLDGMWKLDSENSVAAATRCLESIVRRFGGFVRDTLTAPAPTGRVDLARDERVERCREMDMAFIRGYHHLERAEREFYENRRIADVAGRLRPLLEIYFMS